MHTNRGNSLNKTKKEVLDKQNQLFYTICILAGVILTIIFICLNINRSYSGYKVIDSTERNDSNTKEYLNYDGNKIIKYSNDGITVINEDGKSIWSYSYEMRNASVAVCEKYVAVADIGGTEVYIFDQNGKESKVENVNTISQVEISARGQVALLVEEGNADYIKICDGTANYIDIKTRIKEDGYPLDIAFSYDSKKLITSYMNINEGDVTNTVTCYNLGEVGKNYKSKIVAAFNYEKKMAVRIEFISDDIFAIFSENDISVYTMKEKPELKFKTEEYKNRIESIIYSKDYVGVILDNNLESSKQIKIYTYDGKIKYEDNTEFDYDNIYISKDDIVMYTRNAAEIKNVTGYTKFKGNFKNDMEFVLPYNNKDKFLFITKEKIMKVKLTEGD